MNNDFRNLKFPTTDLIFWFALVGVIVLSGAYGSYRFFADRLIGHAQEDLQGLAKIKTTQIESLLTGCHGNGEVFVVRPSVWRTLSGIDVAQERLRLEKVITDTMWGDGYRRIIVVDTSLQIVAPTSSNPLELIERLALQKAMQTRDFELVNLHRTRGDTIFYGIAHPVFANGNENDTVVGAVYLERDAQQDLYPLLEFRSTSSSSMETILIQREGSDVVFLSRLRFKPDALPLSLRLSVDNALIGASLDEEPGLLRGLDYRGVETVRAIQPVSNTPWIMVTKINRAEIEHPAKMVGIIIFVLAVILWLLLTNIFRLFWYRRSLGMVVEQSAITRRYAAALRTSIDGYLVVDQSGRIVDSNIASIEITGYQADELLTLGIADLEVIASSDEDYARMQRIMVSGNERLLTRWKRKDGMIIDIEASLSFADGYFFVFVRDITERKQAEVTLRRQHELLACIERLQNLFIGEGAPGLMFDSILIDILKLTSSECGFIAELMTDDEGRPHQQMLAISNVARDDDTRHFYEQHVPPGFHFDQFDGLHSAIIVSNDVIIFNNPAQDPRNYGCRLAGHPPLNTFLGLPLRRQREIIGSIGLANRSGGYDEIFVEYLQPIVDVVSQVITAYHNERHRLETEEALRQSKVRFDSLVSCVPVGVYIFTFHANGEMGFEYVSPRFCQIFDISEQLALDNFNNVFSIVHPDDLDSLTRSNMEARETLVPYRWEGRFVIRGETHYLRIESDPTPLMDGGSRWNGVVVDISDRKHSEEELARSNAELAQFAYVASHDLRQPLRTISSYLALLQQKLAANLDEDSVLYMEFCIEGAKRMDALILGLLEYSRVGRMEQAPEIIALHDVIALALGNLELSVAEAAADITVAEELPSIVGYPSELTRLFQNLIGNSINYRARHRPLGINIGWRDEGNDYVIWVRDNGVGIALKDFERAFGIFQRLVSHNHEGTGIGLAICRKVVEHHGGRIWIESVLGEGSSFLMTFPKASVASPTGTSGELSLGSN
ncbi:hypothetical protein CCP3SC1_80043 [Gammaproteobacteria bacterium]